MSCRALLDTNLQWRCWSLKRLCDQWRTGDLPRTRRLLDQILARAAGDAKLLEWGAVLDGAIAAGIATTA